MSCPRLFLIAPFVVACLATNPLYAVNKPGGTHKTGSDDVHKLTCQEYVDLDVDMKPKLIYWAAGYDQKSREKAAVIDVEGTERLVPFIEEDCKTAPKASFWQRFEAAVKRHL